MGADADQGDGQGCWNATRTAAAEALVKWIAADPTGVGDDDTLVLGDLNSYGREDPLDVFAGARFVDLVARSGGDYSYAFDGQWGSLDYALASPSLADQSGGAKDVHINADEPSVLDYNTNFKSPDQVASLFAPDEFRTSDHDPVISGFDLDAGRTVAVAIPFVLFPPDHRLHNVTVVGFGPGGVADVDIVGATSSEADSGLGPRDRPGDIVISPTDPTRLQLRAEAFSRRGRTYEITAVVSDGTQAELRTARSYVLYLPGY